MRYCTNLYSVFSVIAVYVIYILLLTYFLHEKFYLQNVHLYRTSMWLFFLNNRENNCLTLTGECINSLFLKCEIIISLDS